MNKLNGLDWIAVILVVIGALNWGLIAAFSWNLVEALFGVDALAKIIYGLVGLSGLYLLFTLGSLSRK